MTVFIVTEVHIHDLSAMRAYLAAVRPLMARHGGEFLATSASGSEVIEGDPHRGIVSVQRWPDRAAFHAFWQSPEYAPLREQRHAAADSTIVALTG